MVKSILLMKALFSQGIINKKDYTSIESKNKLIHNLSRICEIFHNKSIDYLISILQNKQTGILDHILNKKEIQITGDPLLDKINMSGIKKFIPELNENMDSTEQLRVLITRLEEEEMNSVTDKHAPLILEFRKQLKLLENLKKNFDPNEFINYSSNKLKK